MMEGKEKDFAKRIFDGLAEVQDVNDYDEKSVVVIVSTDNTLFQKLGYFTSFEFDFPVRIPEADNEFLVNRHALEKAMQVNTSSPDEAYLKVLKRDYADALKLLAVARMLRNEYTQHLVEAISRGDTVADNPVRKGMKNALLQIVNHAKELLEEGKTEETRKIVYAPLLNGTTLPFPDHFNYITEEELKIYEAVAREVINETLKTEADEIVFNHTPPEKPESDDQKKAVLLSLPVIGEPDEARKIAETAVRDCCYVLDFYRFVSEEPEIASLYNNLKQRVATPKAGNKMKVKESSKTSSPKP